ncbi:uncharacterized protein LOC124888940 [Capsicum annuum]|uniref:uncharacterized protein LOC124888940 n=1 Tax=Capsicum annuum TaxID=4072 RepID=UPI001FB1862B|nr:uncharacterized protein LOC124888940 [Capsicum annuum]
MVEFDDVVPIGEAQGLFAGFCGILATDSSIFSIGFAKWNDLPESYFNRCFGQIIKKMCKQNAENRKKQTISHIGGSKSNARRRAKIMVETGHKPGRAELYLATHKKEDKSYVNKSVKEICDKIELIVSQSTMDESEVSPNDTVGKVLEKEHSGRLRCLGLGDIPSRSFKKTHSYFGGMSSSSSSSSCPFNCQENYIQMLNAQKQSQENYKEMVNPHNLMMNAFKTYMIMKEGTIPEQFAGFFTPSTTSDVSSGPFLDGNGRSSGDSYSSDDN